MAANGKAVLAVVVPVFATTPGHVLLLVRTLERVQKQTRAPDYVVLVDDGGPLPLPLSFTGMEQVHLPASGVGLAYTVHRRDMHSLRRPWPGARQVFGLSNILDVSAPLHTNIMLGIPALPAQHASPVLLPSALVHALSCCVQYAFDFGPA